MADEGWTIDTLRLHLEALIEANDRRYEQRFKDSGTAVGAALSAAKEAVVKAETAAEKRFESVNEFRGTLSDQQRMLMPRTEAELRFSALESQMHTAVNALQAASTLNAQRIAEITAVGVGAKGELTERRARATDQRLAVGFIISLVVAAIAVIGLVLKLQGGTS